ncbi:MAG: hypothetical protein AB8B54_10335 [Sphingorhabdus sp.]
MTDFQSILRTGSKALSFADDIKHLSSISAIAERYDDIVEKLGQFTSPEDIVDQIIKGTLDEKLEGILKDLGLAKDLKKVTELVSGVQDFSDGNLRPYYNLVKPVSAFDEGASPSTSVVFSGDDDGLVRWPIVSESKKLSAPQKDRYSIDLGLDAELNFEAGDTWPYNSDSMPDPLLRMGFKGSAEAGAKAELPLKIGFIGGEFETKAGIDCQYYYDTKQTNGIFASEVATRLPRLPNPFDFDSVWDAFGDPRYGLSGIILKYDGNIGFDLEVGLGKKFAFAKGIELGANLSVKVGVKRPGSFELSMRSGNLAAGGGKTIVTTLSRGEVKERTVGFGLGIELDLTGAASRVHKLLSEALGHWDKGLEAVKPYLSPGTWIQENLSDQLSPLLDDLIKNAELKQALSDDLQIALGIKSDDESALKEWLKTEIVEKADNVSALATSKASSVGSDIATHIAGSLPGILGTELQNPINEMLDGLLKQLNDRFEKTIEDIWTESDQASLSKTLKKLGDKSSKSVAGLDDFGKRIEALLNRYDKLFKKVVKATGDAANAKISASIEIEDTLVRKATYQFSGEFLKRDDDTRRIFRAMMKGEFQQAAEVLTKQSDGFALDPEKSQITRFRQHTSKFGYAFVVFGLGKTAQKSIDGMTTITYRGDGGVDVASQALGIATESRKSDETRSARFVAASSILASRSLADQPQHGTRMMDLGLQFRHEDDELRRRELDGIIKSLVDIELVPAGTRAKAKDLLDEWVGFGKKAKIKADVDVKLVLERNGLQNLMQISSKDVDPKLDDAARQKIGEGHKLARALVSKFKDISDDGEKIDREIKDYEKMIEYMRNIYFSIPAGLSDSDGIVTSAGWSLEQYNNVEREIEKIAKKKIRHFKEIIGGGGFGNALDHKFLLFMSTLANLAADRQADASGSFDTALSIAIVITRRSKNTAPVTKVLI